MSDDKGNGGTEKRNGIRISGTVPTAVITAFISLLLGGGGVAVINRNLEPQGQPIERAQIELLKERVQSDALEHAQFRARIEAQLKSIDEKLENMRLDLRERRK